MHPCRPREKSLFRSGQVKDGVSRGREAVGAHRQEASSRDSSLETCLEVLSDGFDFNELYRVSPVRLLKSTVIATFDRATCDARRRTTYPRQFLRAIRDAARLASTLCKLRSVEDNDLSL